MNTTPYQNSDRDRPNKTTAQQRHLFQIFLCPQQYTSPEARATGVLEEGGIVPSIRASSPLRT